MKFYITGAFIGLLILACVDYMFADNNPFPICDTDTDCYEKCMSDPKNKPEDCEIEA